MAPTTELSVAITSYQWETAIQVLNRYPFQAKKRSVRPGLFEGVKDSNVLPLHEALVALAPVHVIKALVEAYPMSVREKESSYDRLPLHCACRRNADPATLQYLTELFPGANLEPDALGRLPLHYVLSNGSDIRLVKILLRADRSCCRGVDLKGWTPLHVACSMGASMEVISELLAEYPEAVILKTRKGSTPYKVLPKDLPHYKLLRDALKGAKENFDKTFVNPLRYSPPHAEEMILV